MQEPSTPEDSITSTLTSKYKPPYTCTHCSKQFNNGHAFAGHQNAHRIRKRSSRSRKMDAQATIIGMVLDHHSLSSYFDNNPPPLPPLGGVASGLQFHPPPPPGFDGYVPRCPPGVPKASFRDHGYHICHPYQRGMMMRKVGQRDKEADFNSRGTMMNSLIMVSRNDDDGFERKEELDLELRLGLNCMNGSGGEGGSFPLL